MKTRTRVLPGLVLVICMSAGAASAADFNDGAIHTIDDATYVDEEVRVFNVDCSQQTCPAPGAPTTLSLVSGAQVRDMKIYQTSTLTFLGGSVSGFVEAHDSTYATLTDTGWVDTLKGYESASLLLDSPTAGCNVMWGYGEAAITMTAGNVETRLYAYGDSVSTLTGGTLGNITASNDARVYLDGSDVDRTLEVFGTSVATWTAGDVGANITAGEAARILIRGSNFAVGGTPVGYGELAQPTGTLTGELQSGEPISVIFYHAGHDFGSWTADGTIELPEPATGLAQLCALGVLAVLRRLRAPGRSHLVSLDYPSAGSKPPALAGSGSMPVLGHGDDSPLERLIDRGSRRRCAAGRVCL